MWFPSSHRSRLRIAVGAACTPGSAHCLARYWGKWGTVEYHFPAPQRLFPLAQGKVQYLHPALPLTSVQSASTLQSAVPVVVTVAMLWLAARRSVGTPSAALLGRLQQRFCLGSPRCSPSHLDYSFPGFLIGTFDLCASWRTSEMQMLDPKGAREDESSGAPDKDDSPV